MNAVKLQVPEILLECDEILKGGGRFWDDVTGGHLPEDLVLTARREETDRVHSEGVHESVPMQECKDAGKKPLDLIRVDRDKSVDPTRKKFDRGCVLGSTKRRSKVRYNELHQLLNCCLQCHFSKL